MGIERALQVTMGLAAACLLVSGSARAGGVTVGTSDTQATQIADDSAATEPSDVTEDGDVTQGDEASVVAGRVETVDRADDTIEIEGVDRQLKIDSSTDVTRNGSAASISDLQEGEQVRAAFDDGFPAHVRQIEIMSPSSAKGTGTRGLK